MSDLMAADEATRNNLVSMATAGTDATTAAQLAASGLKQNMESASADKAVASVGDLFNTLSNAYLFQNLGKYAQGLSSINPYVTRGSTSSSDPHSSYQGT